MSDSSVPSGKIEFDTCDCPSIHPAIQLCVQAFISFTILAIAIMRFINTRSQLKKNKSDEALNDLKNIYYSLKTKSFSD